MINSWSEYRRSLRRNLKYLLLLFLFGTSQCDESNPVDLVSIPDSSFLDELIRNGVDTNGDGHISQEEAESSTALYLAPAGIIDLTGIEAFIKLDTLVVEVNPLSSPDLSANLALVSLALKGCGLAELDVSKNTSLKSLDFSGDMGLGSKLTKIDLSGNPELETLICPGNELTVLDLSHNPNLLKLSCNRNRIAELNLSSNIEISELHCKNNYLKSLDLRANTALEIMTSCGNHLAGIDLSLNTGLRLIGIDNMPTLTEVCVWTTPFPPEGIRVLMGFSPNAFFTTSCSN